MDELKGRARRTGKKCLKRKEGGNEMNGMKRKEEVNEPHVRVATTEGSSQNCLEMEGRGNMKRMTALKQWGGSNEWKRRA